MLLTGVHWALLLLTCHKHRSCSVAASAGQESQKLSTAESCDGVFFASFNIQNYGPTKASRSAVVQALAATLTRYDIVAIQEISQMPREIGPCGPYTEDAICTLLAAVNAASHKKYSLQVSPRIGDEQYALMFDAKAVSYIRGATYPDQGSIHSRPPFAFEIWLGSETLVIATTHTRPTGARSELADFPLVAQWMQTVFHADTYIIAGDFNADGTYFDEDTDWQPILSAMPGYALLTGNALDTTVASSSNTYDRVLATTSLKSDPARVFVIEDHVNLSNVFEQGCADGYVPTVVCDSVVWSELTRELSDHYPIEICMHPYSNDSDFTTGIENHTTPTTTTSVTYPYLQPGACAVVGFKADNPDDVGIVFLEEVQPGHHIFLTDNGVQADGSLRRNEGVRSFVAQTVVLSGTVLKLANFSTPSEGSFSLSSSGDQVIVFAGSVDSPTYLCALNLEGSQGKWQSTADSSSSSTLPAALVNGQTALALSEADNAAYSGTLSGSAAELRVLINNASHWTLHDEAGPHIPSSFVVHAAPSSSSSTTSTSVAPEYSPTSPVKTITTTTAGNALNTLSTVMSSTTSGGSSVQGFPLIDIAHMRASLYVLSLVLALCRLGT